MDVTADTRIDFVECGEFTYIFVAIGFPPLRHAQGRDFRKSYRTILINSFFFADGRSIKADFTSAR